MGWDGAELLRGEGAEAARPPHLELWPAIDVEKKTDVPFRLFSLLYDRDTRHSWNLLPLQSVSGSDPF
jgi:hypothetical protein